MSIIIICGQTATGKSSLAIKLAKELQSRNRPAEIISADSRQIYTGLDTSSNKVTAEEMQGVPHHMISIAPCASRYTVADFQTQARALIAELIENGITPILCGGTGLYIDAVMYNSFVFGNGTKGSIDYTMPHWHPHSASRLMPHAYSWIGLTAPREYLANKIKTLAEQKFDRIQSEISSLLQQGISKEWLTGLGLEPRYMVSVLDGAMTHDEYINQLTTKTWQYARRQITWFKRNPNITWFDVSKSSQQDIIDSLLHQA